MSREFVKFLLAGGTGAGVNIVARFGLDFILLYDVAIILAYGAGMLTTFALSRGFVFTAAHGSFGGQAGRFALVNLLAVFIVWSVSVALARGLFPALNFTWHTDHMAHIIGVLSTAVTSYLLHKYFTFA